MVIPQCPYRSLIILSFLLACGIPRCLWCSVGNDSNTQCDMCEINFAVTAYFSACVCKYDAVC